MLRVATSSRLLVRRSLDVRMFTSAATQSSGSSPANAAGGTKVGRRELPEHEAWQRDTAKYPELQNLPGGRQHQKDFGMGPYASHYIVDPVTKKVTPHGSWFIDPRKDPVSFVVNVLCALTVLWVTSRLSWGESFMEKRKRVIRDRIRQEYGLPKGWEHEIEDADLDLADTVESGSVALPTSVPSQ
mmetsp:Transcript_51888/g.121383  ORF Transcript_51888/g.121383 Transcript_51888/m.121383 type:complete len:186 (+) Transcript_51888:64-621(+)